jgi:hypothetical protein
MERHSSRGLAFADYDNVGLVEAVVNNQARVTAAVP